MKRKRTEKPARSNGKHPGGRPTIRTPENARQICWMLAEGKMLREVCTELTISPAAISEWEAEDEEFAKAIARARIAWADVAAEEGAELAAQEPRMIVGEDGTERVDSGWVQHITSRLNYTKWLISKRDPKRFGEKDQNTNVTVGVGVQVAVLSEEKRQQIIQRKQLAIRRRVERAKPLSITNGNGNGHSHH